LRVFFALTPDLALPCPRVAPSPLAPLLILYIYPDFGGPSPATAIFVKKKFVKNFSINIIKDYEYVFCF
jgi:hypothetical protein